MDTEQALCAVRAKHPLVHCINNFVTATDCANAVLAVGGSPIMAQAVQEAEQISTLADAVVLNTGTPDEEKFQACLLSGKAANRKGIPVVLDPVGVGASPWRKENVYTLLRQIHFSVIRANASEAKTLLDMDAGEHGVDNAEGIIGSAALAQALAKRYSCTVLLTGASDFISDGSEVREISGGSSRMGLITGAGCMLSALCGAFAASVPQPYEAACAASAFWKGCAARAAQKAEGAGAFHTALFDEAGKENY